MPPKMRSRLAWLALVCAVLAAMAIIHWARTFSQSGFVTVLDGDTLACADGRLIRLIGIAGPREVPEVEGVDGPVYDAGRSYLKGLIEGRSVRIRPVKGAADARGRISAYVYLGGVLVNGRMIRDGYALADPRRGYPEYELFEAYEAEARLRRLGIWKAAGRDNGAGEGR